MAIKDRKSLYSDWFNSKFKYNILSKTIKRLQNDKDMRKNITVDHWKSEIKEKYDLSKCGLDQLSYCSSLFFDFLQNATCLMELRSKIQKTFDYDEKTKKDFSFFYSSVDLEKHSTLDAFLDYLNQETLLIKVIFLNKFKEFL